MTRPTGKINSAKIVTKKFIRIIIVPTRRRKGTMTTKISSPVKKVKPLLKTFPKKRRRLRRSLPPYKLI